ncbi:DUF5641 domain-containing protein [Trichonephila clavata]|uniref:DUF5641 domain-containing protein n=1 Tax=Trichonephila clavata TaxID=2740835 RepID=A0A8X6IWR8_TRICU|nr:DUF5641 domain-containing protein [Trichonephila clavata]GFQ84422.1 DUF5641 domain-containing protein [Trichonephila clavata]GFQ90525.1 DUF5641 domain-containing protein [Trichonephila clavata]GFR22833.1 DUF5641 domain-containing protein [Trichonephila clavata]
MIYHGVYFVMRARPCQLVQARARVAPIYPSTIPRLELLACTIASRFVNTTKIHVGLEKVQSAADRHNVNVLHWIKRRENWGTLVKNRVREWPLSETCPERTIIDSERKRTVA